MKKLGFIIMTLASSLLLSGCYSGYGDRGEKALLEKNPFTECPDKPNCVRESRTVDGDSDNIWKQAEKAVTEMGGEIKEQDEQTHQLHATFDVYFFTDDFRVAVDSLSENKSVIHLRSSSRIGRSDLGVNIRRVEGFWEMME